MYIGPVGESLLTSPVEAYSLIEPSVNITVLSIDENEALDMINNNTADLSLYAGYQSIDNAITYPDTVYYPLLATGVAPNYHLPNMPAGFYLTVNLTVMAQILLGEIQYCMSIQLIV